MFNDPRFDHAKFDPRFRRPPKKPKVEKVDDRFVSELTSDKFKLITSKVDETGKPITQKDHLKMMQSLYKQPISDILQDHDHVDEEDSFGESDWDDLLMDLIDAQLDKRMSSNIQSLKDQAQIDYSKAAEITHRIAVLELDWDNVDAQHLFLLFQSFLQPNQKILGVTIYQSDFGKEKMEHEAKHGPPPEIFKSSSNFVDSQGQTLVESLDISGYIPKQNTKKNSYSQWTDWKSTIESMDENPFNMEALKEYEILRRKYFYAIAEFDSPQSADYIFDQLYGQELELSGNFITLQFVPNDTDFSDKTPHQECKAKDFSDYVPHKFITPSTQYTDFGLSWEDVDTKRAQLLKQSSTNQGDEIDFSAYSDYIAPPQEISEESQNEAEKLKALLLGSKNDVPKKNKISISFSSGFADPGQLKGENSDDDDDSLFTKTTLSKSVQDELEKVAPVTTDHHEFDSSDSSDSEDENMIESKNKDDLDYSSDSKSLSEFKSSKNVFSEITSSSPSLVQEQGFDMVAILRHQKLSQARNRYSKQQAHKLEETGVLQPDFELDVEDPRFAEIFTDARYYIDPQHKSFIQTNETSKLVDYGNEIRNTILEQLENSSSSDEDDDDSSGLDEDEESQNDSDNTTSQNLESSYPAKVSSSSIQPFWQSQLQKLSNIILPSARQKRSRERDDNE